MSDAADEAVIRLGEQLAVAAIEGWTGRRMSQLSAAQKLAAVRAVESARGFKSTDELIAEGAAAAGAGEAEDLGEG